MEAVTPDTLQPFRQNQSGFCFITEICVISCTHQCSTITESIITDLLQRCWKFHCGENWFAGIIPVERIIPNPCDPFVKLHTRQRLTAGVFDEFFESSTSAVGFIRHLRSGHSDSITDMFHWAGNYIWQG